MNKVSINTDIIKLDSFLKWSGAVSQGSEAKMFIQDGHIKVNGEIETRRSRKLTKGDTVEFNNECYEII